MNKETEQDNLQKPESLQQLLGEITPDIYFSLRTAVEIGKWGDGSKLSSQQLESSMQAIILYESKNVPENERTGFNLPNNCSSKPSVNREEKITLRQDSPESDKEENEI